MVAERRDDDGVSCIFRILLALWRQRDLKVSEGRGSPIILWAVFMTLWRAILSAAEQLAYHSTIQYVSKLSIEQEETQEKRAFGYCARYLERLELL